MGKILVTGGTGYIGSHTAVALLEEGHHTLIADDLSNSRLSVLDGIENITGIKPDFQKIDLVNKEAVNMLFKENPNISGVIHFAAKKAVGESVRKPLLYYRSNIDPIINILESMMEKGIGNFVFSSSCTVYGQPDELPVTESASLKPAESPYGYTKQVGEAILRDTCTACPNFNAIALRYFNPAGAHESSEIGELPSGLPDNLVPFVTQTAAGIRSSLKIFGDDYNTPDGSAIRDYIHVVDLAKAHVAALNRQLSGKQKNNFEFFNLGTGSGVSVLEVVKTFERVNRLKLNYEIVERRAGDVEQIYADTVMANKELGWRAELGLEDMLKSSWKWEQNLNQLNQS